MNQETGIFISHLTAESTIAAVIKQYLSIAFGGALKIFVSSDGRSIPSGKGWFDYILAEIPRHSVVLVLLSDISSPEPWINFEAGVGFGAGRTVIPIAIRSFNFAKLHFPLRGVQGRLVQDIEGILYEVATAVGSKHNNIDVAGYLRDLAEAERKVTNRIIAARPFIFERNGSYIKFEVQNLGNIDVDLISLEIQVPATLVAAAKHYFMRPPTVAFEESEDSTVTLHLFTEWTEKSSLMPLMKTLTPSMGVRKLDLRIPYKPIHDLGANGPNAVIKWQIFARNYLSEPDEILYKSLSVRDA